MPQRKGIDEVFNAVAICQPSHPSRPVHAPGQTAAAVLSHQ
jgi:hypothetical protein